jgi:nucleoside-diphosphate-sugar epimerase
MAPGADPLDDVQARFDISAAERELGYRPRISLDSGIRSYAGWLAARQ